MKTILLTAAAMGFAISAASAECPGHSKVQASVDTETKVASVVKQVPPPMQETTATDEAEQAD